jgi:hypothetical protein
MTTGFIIGFGAGVMFVLVAWAYLEGRNAEHWNR